MDGLRSAGVANTNSAMKARLMKYAASTRPTVMKNGEKPAFGSGLPGDAGDQRVTGDTVPIPAPMAPPAEDEPAADQGAGNDGGYCCHSSFLFDNW